MSIADIEFMKMCRDILDNGTSTEGQKVRPHWPDGTPAYTIMKFCEINRFDLRNPNCVRVRIDNALDFLGQGTPKFLSVHVAV